MSAGNLPFFKGMLCDEVHKKDEVGGVGLTLSPWVKRLPLAMRLPLEDWAANKVADMRTCYAAFFLGSGCINGRLVKIRLLISSRVFACCRSRLLTYLVPRAPARQRICALAASAVPAISSTAIPELFE